LFERCNWRWNTKGFEFLPSAGTTDPNSLTFIECQVGNNTDHGFSVEHANGVVWLGGSIQYNGTTGVAGEYGCKFIDPGTGYGNISFFGTIFEGNGGDADLWVDATSDASMTTVIGCSFARANDTNYATNHIRMSGAAAVQRLVLRGNTHRHFNAYVENAARPYINLANANCDVHDDGSNYYQSTTEDPAWNLTAIGYGMNYNGQLWRVGTDQVIQVGPAFSVVGGVMVQGLTDNFGSLVPLELRSSALRLTASGGVGIGMSPVNSWLDIAAGTTAKASAAFTAGTVMTSVTAGAWEYDGVALYFAVAASARGVVAVKQLATVQGTAVALTNNIATAQSIFAAANDTLTVAASTTYRFRAKLSFNTGATSHTTAFGFGGTATFTNIEYISQATSTAANTLAAPQMRRVTAATAAVLTAASTAVTTDIWIEGVMRINGAGTIIPQVTFSAGPTGTCETAINSFLEIEPIGSNTVAAVGQWA
jgi:hypothetical protein